MSTPEYQELWEAALKDIEQRHSPDEPVRCGRCLRMTTHGATGWGPRPGGEGLPGVHLMRVHKDENICKGKR